MTYCPRCANRLTLPPRRRARSAGMSGLGLRLHPLRRLFHRLFRRRPAREGRRHPRTAHPARPTALSPGSWQLPGGYAEHDELLASAVEREVREEASVEARFRDVVGFRHMIVGPSTNVYIVCRLDYVGRRSGQRRRRDGGGGLLLARRDGTDGRGAGHLQVGHSPCPGIGAGQTGSAWTRTDRTAAGRCSASPTSIRCIGGAERWPTTAAGASTNWSRASCSRKRRSVNSTMRWWRSRLESTNSKRRCEQVVANRYAAARATSRRQHQPPPHY